MREFQAQNKCNYAGAWLMITLQGDEIPISTNVVITFWFHYANVVVGQEKPTSRRSCTWVFVMTGLRAPVANGSKVYGDNRVAN